MDDLLARLAEGKATDDAYREVIFQIGIYQKGTWGFIRHFYGSLNPYVDRWLKVLPSYKEAFTRRYEVHGKLSVAEQGALIREMIAAIPNKGDPYHLRQSQEGRAMLRDLGILEEAKEKENKPETTGQEWLLINVALGYCALVIAPEMTPLYIGDAAISLAATAIGDDNADTLIELVGDHTLTADELVIA